MYISKLHLQGFKSFLNKINLSFGECITAVLDPKVVVKTKYLMLYTAHLEEQKISILRATKKEDGVSKILSVNLMHSSLVRDFG